MGRRTAPLLAPVALALLLTPAVDARADACTVSGQGNVADLRVAVRGADPFLVDVTGATLTATPTAARARTGAAVHVTAPLDFFATTDPSHVPYRFAAAADVASGALHVVPETRITAVQVRGTGLAADVEIEEGAIVRALPLACGALVVGETPPPASPTPPETAGRSWAPLHGTIRLYTSARTSGRAALEVKLDVPDAFVLHEVSAETNAIQVRRTFERGGSVTGWVRRSDVRDAAGDHARIGSSQPLGGLGLCGTGAGGGGEYLGPATLTTGSLVYVARARTAWARAPGDVQVTVRYMPGDDWVQVLSVQGIRDHEGCPDELDRAWVERTSVVFPPRAHVR